MSSDLSFAGIDFGYDSDEVFKKRDEQMCSLWKNTDKEFELCSLKIMNNPYGSYIVKGKLKGALSQLALSQDVYLKFWAANKPTYILSYAGSGLPYPNEEIAFQDTNNIGAVKTIGNEFTFNLEYPNSYYKHLGKKYVPPQVKFMFCDGKNKGMSKVYTINLGNGIPFRSLTWNKRRDWNNGPLFYCNENLPIRTQEDILRQSGYPCRNREPSNFWGMKPPR